MAPSTAPMGTTWMVIKSIQAPTRSSDSMKIPTPIVSAEQMTTAVFLPSLKCVCQLSDTASNILIREVRPANRTDRKKNAANSRPIGICWNTVGRVMNMRGGPDFTSRP